jgi:Mrp family chromosome partitioning ATPase
MVVRKADSMLKQLKMPVMAVVENMSYFVCPDCGKQHEIYGPSHIEALAKSVETEISVRLPIDPALAALADIGKIEEYSSAEISELIQKTGM